MHPNAASQGQCGPARRTWRDGGLDFDLQARPQRRRGAPVQIRLLQLLPRGSEDRVAGTEAQRSTGGFLGSRGTNTLCDDVRDSRHSQLALHLFPSSVLLLRSQPFLPKWVLPALWRQPGRAAGLGRKQLRQALNWTWFYNGYHAEHHFRPKVHWTRMQAFRDQIVERQRAAGVRVIKPPHALGFLDPNLPPHTKSGSMREEPHPI